MGFTQGDEEEEDDVTEQIVVWAVSSERARVVRRKLSIDETGSKEGLKLFSLRALASLRSFIFWTLALAFAASASRAPPFVLRFKSFKSSG